MRNWLIYFLIFTTVVLSAFEESQTLYTANRYFVTFGEIDFIKSVDEVSNSLLKYNDYSQWALQGMDGVDHESEGLTVFFTDIRYCAENGVFIIDFDINLIWPFGSKGNELFLKPFQNLGENGELLSIEFVPQISTKLIEEASFEIVVVSLESGVTSVNYLTRVKLSKFLDFFFSLRSYKKNAEWYILKMTENLALNLNGGF